MAIPRGAQRGYGDPDASAVSNHRYVEGQRIYLRECCTPEHASVVIDNNALLEAAITRRNAVGVDSA